MCYFTACYTSLVMMAKLHELHFELLPYPPFSADLAPGDYFLFVVTQKDTTELSSSVEYF